MKHFIAIALLFSIGIALGFTPPQEYTRTGEDYSSLAPRASSHLDDPEWLFNLSWAYFEAGMNSDALRYAKLALEQKPNMAFLNARVGDIFLTIGERDSAIFYYEAAINNHYEYIEVWEKLVGIEPRYNANIGLLYANKADADADAKLAGTAKRYLRAYLEQFPDGEFAEQSRAAVSRMGLLERQGLSRENLQNEYLSAQAEQARRQAEMRQDQESFRTEKPFIVGIGFYSIGMADDKDFIAKSPDEVIDDTLSLKTYATSLNEFGISFGYVKGALFYRGAVRFGSNSSGKNYFLRDPDTTQTKDDVRPKVSSVDTWRLTAGADYNLYFKNPVLIFVGAQAGIGSAKLNDSPYNNFKSVTLAGAGLGGGLMFRFSDFLIEFAYRQDLVGSSSGGTIVVGGSYKF